MERVAKGSKCMSEKQLRSPSKRNPWSLISLPHSLPPLNKKNDTSPLLHFQLHPILVEWKIAWIWNSKLSNTQKKRTQEPWGSRIREKRKAGCGAGNRSRVHKKTAEIRKHRIRSTADFSNTRMAVLSWTMFPLSENVIGQIMRCCPGIWLLMYLYTQNNLSISLFLAGWKRATQETTCVFLVGIYIVTPNVLCHFYDTQGKNTDRLIKKMLGR